MTGDLIEGFQESISEVELDENIRKTHSTCLILLIRLAHSNV